MSDALATAANSPATPPRSAPTPDAKPRRRGRPFLIAVILLATMAIGIGLYWFLFMRGVVSSDDARFDADLIDFSPQIAGTLISVNVREGDRVKQGEPLFTLDSRMLESALSQANSAVSSAQAQLAVATANYDKALHGSRPEEIQSAQSAAERLKAMAELAKAELARMQDLAKRGGATEDELDRARAEGDATMHAHAQAMAQLKILQDGTRKEDLAAAKAELDLATAQVAQAQAAVASAKVNLEYATVVAPTDGYIVRRWRDPGATVQPGTPVVTLFNPATLRISANIEEKYLNRVAIGDKVDVDVDAYPGLNLVGRVKKIMRATNSEFSVVPAEGVSGTFIKVTQRVRLRIELENPPDVLVGPGLSVEVHIHDHSAVPDTREAGAP